MKMVWHLALLVAVLWMLRWSLIFLAYVAAAVASRLAPKRFSDEDARSRSTGHDGEKVVLAWAKSYLSGLVRYVSLHSGKIPSNFVRLSILRHVFKSEIAADVVVYMGYELRNPHNIRIGTGSIIGNDAKLDARYGITIGKNVNFSTGVWIWTQQHDPNDEGFASTHGAVVIGDRAWVSSRVTILPGVKIGEGAVIAAGAVVTKDVEPFAFYGGIPAKKIGERNRNLTYNFDGTSAPFY